MKYMIILLSLALGRARGSAWGYAPHWAGPPAHIQLSHDGKHVLDTPEVAHARAAHAHAHAAAAARAGHGGGWEGPWDGGVAHIGGPISIGHEGAPGAGLHKYGPAPLAHDGRVIDTPEVAHLKAAHIQALAQASHGALGHARLALAPALGPHYAEGHGQWHGPPAHIQLTHDGKFVVDTPEVQHARAAHLAAHAHAGHLSASSPAEPWGQDGYEGAGWDGGAGAWGHGGPYLADTPAVAHARAAHLAAKAAIVGHGPHGWA